jgi:hypothetical protein
MHHRVQSREKCVKLSNMNQQTPFIEWVLNETLVTGDLLIVGNKFEIVLACRKFGRWNEWISKKYIGVGARIAMDDESGNSYVRRVRNV